jgi:Mn-containing catalase
MFVSINILANQLPKDKPDNRAAYALQEGFGGQFGEMRTMMQYLFQNFNFRGKAKPYQDLINSVAGEEIGHVEK